LPEGAIAGLGYAQSLYLLPVSLFGMAVSASELPEMSSVSGGAEVVAAHLRTRLAGGLRRIAFFVIPSAVAFVALGDIVVGAILGNRGQFTHQDAVTVWAILAGSGVGLLASTQGRLYSSAFYALKDTKTPLRFAAIRVALTTVLGYLCSQPLPALLGIDPKWGVAGLTASAGVSGWVEFVLLRRALLGKIGAAPAAAGYLMRFWGIAVAAAGLAWAIKLGLGTQKPIVLALATLVPYGAVYLSLADPGMVRATWGGLLRRR
jgi:putative peptidoglycan lipid II flippase